MDNSRSHAQRGHAAARSTDPARRQHELRANTNQTLRLIVPGVHRSGRSVRDMTRIDIE